jgi:hypothetical protein
MGMEEFDVLMGDMIYHKHNNSTNRWFMETMKTCETFMPGLKKIGMDVSHVQVGDMRSIYKQHRSKFLTSQGHHIIHRVNGIIIGREGTYNKK